MAEQRVTILGLLIAVAFVLNAVGVFTPSWVVDTGELYGVTVKLTAGIVPFSTDEPSWLAAGSWLMFISFALFFAIIAAYVQVYQNTSRNGFSYRDRSMFHIIAGVSGIIVIFTVIAVILFGVNFAGFNDIYDTFSLGYSAWLCVASAVITLVISLMSEHIAIAYCN